ncbi:MAG: periplasmic divalent cation tolerance protein [Actinomycetota bacterium]|jgi:periplasmic divalent cation tolerance protein|nr:periplasmic divalent cation tolerance protein [Actinomycetota bacterium]
MSDGEVCEVIITADDADWLADFTRKLVEERLAACGQNIASIRSIYRWKGKVQDEPEARVALHTRCNLVQKIVDRANRDHPYEVPCVIALPVKYGNTEYINWVLAETAEVDR